VKVKGHKKNHVDSVIFGRASQSFETLNLYSVFVNQYVLARFFGIIHGWRASLANKVHGLARFIGIVHGWRASLANKVHGLARFIGIILAGASLAANKAHGLARFIGIILAGASWAANKVHVGWRASLA
jgi:hypothetical protein